MDSWHQTFLWLICVICINPALFMKDYCSGLIKTPAISVCQNNKVTGGKVYIDSTGAPLGQTTVCKCCLTNDYPVPLLAITYNTTREHHGIQFEVSTFVFKEDTPNEKREIPLDRTNIEITFTKTTMKDTAAGCLGFEIDPSSSSGNITITCYSADHSFSTTIATTQEQLSTGSSLSVNTGLIAGAVGGGCVPVVLVVLIIVACKRRNQRQSNTRGSPQLSSKPNEEPDYDMTENAMYNCDEDLTSKFSSKTPTLHDAQDDVTYAIVSKTNDIENVYDVTKGNLANSPRNTGNLYNTLHQCSSHINKTDEDVQNQYDYTNNAKAMSRQQTDNVYDKTTN